MDWESDVPLLEKERKRSSNYRVRFRHGVYPEAEGNATRADIKKYDYFFSEAQPWVHTPENVGFVDETAQVSSDNDSISPVVAKRLRPQRPTRTQTAVKDVRTLSEQGAGSELGGAYDSANANALIMDTSMPSIAPNSPAWAGVMYYTQPSPAASSVSARSLEVRSSFDCDPDLVSDQVPVDDFQRQNISPQISDPVEAKLFRYYVKCVGPRIDIVSPENVFTDVIPRLACTNFMLLNAVFMIASQYILRVEPLFPAKPYVYQERTLQLLLAYIARYGKIEDEVALVTAIFLRGFEESHAGTRGQEHLSTLELFRNSDGWQCDMSSPVTQACFMIHVHFEIYHALLCRPSLRVDYQTWMLPTLEFPSNDVSWANRIVWICARILQWADSSQCTSKYWYILKELVDEWEHEQPEGFKKSQYGLSNHTERTSLQNARLQQCHVDALQHLSICRMALATSYANLTYSEQLKVPGNGPNDVVVHIKELVTIARLNMFSGWSSQIASHALHRFGTGLEHPADRWDIITFLEIVDSSSLPTVATQERLMSHWGWQL